MQPASKRRWELLALSLCLAVAAHAGEPAPALEKSFAESPAPALVRLRALRMSQVPGVAQKNAPPLTPRPSYAEQFRAAQPFLQRISANVQGSGLSWPADSELQSAEFTDNAKRGVIRATKRTVKRFLVDAMQLDRLRPDSGPAAAEDPGKASEPANAVKFRLGVSHRAPRVDMRSELGSVGVNLSLGLLGQVGLDLDTARLAGARIHVGYDHPSKTYAFALRMAF